MGSKWRKVKLALGHNLCAYVPRTSDDPTPSARSGERLSNVAMLTKEEFAMNSSGTQVPIPPGSTLSKSGSRSLNKTCSICLSRMRRGDGHAIFTAECSHSFHFHCITSNVKHGNQICPVCRAKWKEIPFYNPTHNRTPLPAFNHPNLPPSNAVMAVIRSSPLNRMRPALYQSPEPTTFDDDETLNQLQNSVSSIRNVGNILSESNTDESPRQRVDLKTIPEVSAVPSSESRDNFTILVNLKASPAVPSLVESRAPVDLVTVLDISGSMAGTKLALLKRAMGFVIHNLGPNDRLSVIAFSSAAARLFPLKIMSDAGRRHALTAVNSLTASGGTNIFDGLKKAAKVVSERRDKSPLASVILLSDGQDTYTFNTSNVFNGGLGLRVPVHTFGFGADHDAGLMHTISENSGGTFSFIETEAIIQDAFAQCIGGLLSVVVLGLRVRVECADLGISIVSLETGSYPSRKMDDGLVGFIDVGDLYADEEKDFLVSVTVPTSERQETSLVGAKCIYRDPFTKETVTIEMENVIISRQGEGEVAVEVERQRNRVRAAEAMAGARALAEVGDLSAAVGVLERCRVVVGRCGDRMCVGLDAEMKEMQERMGSRQVYAACGRAYVLSGLSSHSWQRATARGDSTDECSLVRAYQTPSMTQMLSRSQTLSSPPKPR